MGLMDPKGLWDHLVHLDPLGLKVRRARSLRYFRLGQKGPMDLRAP